MCLDFCLVLYMCCYRPEALCDLLAVLEGDYNVLLVNVGSDEVVAVDLPIEGESHGLAVRVLVSRDGTTVANGAPVVVVRG